MSTKPTYKSHADARAAGWFSRRHQTNEALERARASRAAKKRLQEERIIKANKK